MFGEKLINGVMENQEKYGNKTVVNVCGMGEERGVTKVYNPLVFYLEFTIHIFLKYMMYR